MLNQCDQQLTSFVGRVKYPTFLLFYFIIFYSLYLLGIFDQRRENLKHRTIQQSLTSAAPSPSSVNAISTDLGIVYEECAHGMSLLLFSSSHHPSDPSHSPLQPYQILSSLSPLLFNLYKTASKGSDTFPYMAEHCRQNHVSYMPFLSSSLFLPILSSSLSLLPSLLTPPPAPLSPLPSSP